MIGPIATDLILIDGLSIRYAVDRRVSTGTPILLTTPFPESVFAFLPVWEDFAALGPVIAVDLPGFGRSEARQDLMSPSAMGEFLIKILDAFELERVHAVVPDVGTLAALFAASTNPGRFASIVAGSGGMAMDLSASHWRRSLAAAGLISTASMVASRLWGLYGSSQGSHLQTPSSRTIDCLRWEIGGTRLRILFELTRRNCPGLPRLLPQIDVAVLVLSGSGDPFVPISNGEFLQAHLPRCEAHVIEAGHFVWEDAPRNTLTRQRIGSSGMTRHCA